MGGRITPFFYFKWVSAGYEWAAVAPIIIVLSGWGKVSRHGPSTAMRKAMQGYRDQLAKGRAARAERTAEVTAATVEAARLAGNPSDHAAAAGGRVAALRHQ